MCYTVSMTTKNRPSKYQDKEFLELRKKWYKKLQTDGKYKDIENIDWNNGESGNLLNGVSQADVCTHYSKEQEEYYAQARAWLHEIRNRAKVLRAESKAKQAALLREIISMSDTSRELSELSKVWKLHSDGKSFRTIERRLHIARKRIGKMVEAEDKQMLGEMRQRLRGQESPDWFAKRLKQQIQDMPNDE